MVALPLLTDLVDDMLQTEHAARRRDQVRAVPSSQPLPQGHVAYAGPQHVPLVLVRVQPPLPQRVPRVSLPIAHKRSRRALVMRRTVQLHSSRPALVYLLPRFTRYPPS